MPSGRQPPLVTADGSDGFDPDLILAVFDAHGVEYLLVGGLAARAYGAQRRTADVDCVPNTTIETSNESRVPLRDLKAACALAG